MSNRLPISEIGNIVCTVKKWNPSQFRQLESFNYIDLSSVDQKEKRIVSALKINSKEAPSRARQLVREGDVLVSTVRPNLNGVACVPRELDGATASTGFCVLRPKEKELDGRYLFHWVQTARFIGEMVKLATGANYPAISDRIVKASEFPLPPLPEQKRIAAILDKADAIRRKRQQAIKHADDFLRSTFLYNFGDPFINPKEWEVKELRELIKLQGGYAFKSSDYVQSGIPLVRIGNANKGKFDFSNIKFLPESYRDRYSKFILMPGDLAITLTGTVGKEDYGNVVKIPDNYDIWLLNQRVVKIIITNKNLTPDYLSFFLRHPSVKNNIIKNSRGIRQANLNNEDILSQKIQLPPFDELNKFDLIVRNMEIILEKLQLFQSPAEVFSNSLTQLAFRGEL